MKKYLVRFTTKSGDYDKEWCHANSEEEAKNNILSEHWNIAHIDMVSEL
jgi:type II secretory pathway component PulF